MPWLTENRQRLDGFRSGDGAVLTEVYRFYSPQIADLLANGFSFRSGAQHCRFHGYATPYDLDDAIQDIFLRAFAESARRNYDGVRPFGQYLNAIARHLVIDRFRKASRQSSLFAVATDPVDLPEPGPLVSPETLTMEGQLRALLRDFKQGLTELERQVFELRFEQQLPRIQIAERLDLGPMRIRTCEKRMRKRLLKQLETGGCHLEVAVVCWLLFVTEHVRWG